MRQQKHITEAYELFKWLADSHEGNWEEGENMCAILEWVLRLGTRRNGSPIPEMLDDIREAKEVIRVNKNPGKA